MSLPTKNNQSRSNKIGTYIGRAFIGLLGVGLLIVLVATKVWKSADVKTLIAFAAVIGLFIGYGFGGDIWGARLFDLFTLQNSRRYVKQDGEQQFVPRKTTLLFLLGILLVLLALGVAVTIGWRHFL